MTFAARMARRAKPRIHGALRRMQVDVERAGEAGALRLVRIPSFGVDPWHDVRTILGGDPRCVFDVGGHFGETALRLHDEYPRARIYSFEPDPDSFGRLARKTAECPGVEPVPAALGDQTGDATLYRNKESMTNSLLPALPSTEDYLVEPDFLETRGACSVRVTTADEFAEERGLEEVDLLKVDAQGYELKVLDGASGLVGRRKIPLLYLEVNFVSLYEGQPLFPELYDYVRARDYRLVGFYETGYRTHFYLVACNALFVAAERGAVPRAGGRPGESAT